MAFKDLIKFVGRISFELRQRYAEDCLLQGLGLLKRLWKRSRTNISLKVICQLQQNSHSPWGFLLRTTLKYTIKTVSVSELRSSPEGARSFDECRCKSFYICSKQKRLSKSINFGICALKRLKFKQMVFCSFIYKYYFCNVKVTQFIRTCVSTDLLRLVWPKTYFYNVSFAKFLWKPLY